MDIATIYNTRVQPVDCSIYVFFDDGHLLDLLVVRSTKATVIILGIGTVALRTCYAVFFGAASRTTDARWNIGVRTQTRAWSPDAEKPSGHSLKRDFRIKKMTPVGFYEK